MKFYKQAITNEQTISPPVLLSEHGSVEEAKRAAERIAREDNCNEIMWSFAVNASRQKEPPYELVVNDGYRLIVRDW